MQNLPPGFRPERLVTLMQAAIRRCGLDLRGMVVLTEAASGAYMVTPVLAAMADAAHVFALARTSRYGTIEDITRATHELARLAAVDDRIAIISERRGEVVAQADIVTNTGHLRPLDAEVVGWMKPTAVIPLMFEAWELRSADVDLAACQRRWIPVAGTDECHPAIDVMPFVGIMAVRLLLDAGVAVHGSRVLLWCDNPFRPFLAQQLTQAGATVECVARLEDGSETACPDAILVAVRPDARPIVDEREAQVIARRYPNAIVSQLWGDMERVALARAGVPFWPLEAPPAGHQGISLCSLGPEPVVRLQAGGLKVGEVMARERMVQGGGAASHAAAIAAAVVSGFGQELGPPTPRQAPGG